MNRLERMYKFMPKLYRAENSTMIKAILKAWAAEDEAITSVLQDAKDQLYIRRASGVFLDYLAANLGISRPGIIPWPDDRFRRWIIEIAWGPRQTTDNIWHALETVWPYEYLHATITSLNWENYNLHGGEVLTMIVDGIHHLSVVFRAEDITVGAATVQEICDRINSWLPEYVFAWPYYDAHTGETVCRLSTNTYGSAGSIEVIPNTEPGGDANLEIQFPAGVIHGGIVDVIEVNPGEIVIVIPDEIHLSQDILQGTHRFHPDQTIYDGQPTITAATPYWPGSFFYDDENHPTPGTIGLTSISAVLGQNLFYTGNGTILVQVGSDTSRFPNQDGYVVFNFGSQEQEVCRYKRRLTNDSIELDLTYVQSTINPLFGFNTQFNHLHGIGDVFNLCYLNPAQMDLTTAHPNTPKIPRKYGQDYAIYFLDPRVGQALTEMIMEFVTAAGIVIRYVIRYN